MTDPTPLGSDAWIGADRYNNTYTKRIVDFMNSINEQALQAYASRLRDHRPCTLSDKFSVGTTNLVRKLHFNDGVEWIARLRMPPSEGNALDKEKALAEMQCELDTMEFVRQKTDIPIPKVYGYDLSEENVVGCPFSLMEYVRGNTAEELSRNTPRDHDGIPESFQDKFWRQIAWIMIQLASVRVSKIGSLYRDAKNRDTFTVGPLVETGSGPYDSVDHFYDDYPLALDASLKINQMEEVEGQGALLRYFRELAKSLPQRTSPQGNDGGELGGFGLLNGDLGPNNVLVDHEFKVLAVIDWDDVVSAPDIALYRIPAFMGIDLGIPGRFSKKNPASMKRLQLCRRFVDIVEDVTKRGPSLVFDGKSRVRGPQRLFPFQRAKFFCKEALAIRSLTAAMFKQKHANERWLEGLRWLSERDEKTIVQFYVEDD